RGRARRGAEQPRRPGGLPGRHRRRGRAAGYAGRHCGKERAMTTQASRPVLEVRDLSARYGKVHALTGVSLSVSPCSIVTVIGANGAGKSTLLNAIMGSLPLSGPAAGGLHYDGHDIGAWPVERRVAAGMSLVPERRELF